MDIFDSTIVKLDEEFKAGLQSIRAYLMNLTSPQAARCCGEWLQKLRNSSDEREVRNVLLKRLTCQVQTRRLEYPFDRLPPDRPLYTVYEEGDTSSWSTGYESNSKDTTSPTSAAEDGGGDGGGGSTGVRRHRTHNRRLHRHHQQSTPATTAAADAAAGGGADTWDGEQQQTHQVVERRQVRSRGEQTEPPARRTPVTVQTDFPQSAPDTPASTRRREEEMSGYVEEYKRELYEYRRMVQEDLAELAERVDTTIQTNSQLHNSQLDQLHHTLHDAWTLKLQGVEEELAREVSKLECELQTDRSKYEARIQHLNTVIQGKDDKINSLDSKMKQQAVALKDKMKSVKTEITAAARHNDIQYKKKYSVLRKQLVDLESVNKELMKQYEQSIVLTVKDYESKVKSAKLLAASESMTEMEDKIKQLEQIYQRIFHEYKKKMEKERKGSERSIKPG